MKSLRETLIAPACYALLCYGERVLPPLSVHLAEAICKSWGVDLETLDRLGVVRWPTSVENHFAAAACAEMFGDLSGVEGFFRHNNLWRLDLDDDHCERGFLMPVSNPRFGYVDRVVAFKHPSDRHPFPLKTRREMRAAA